MHFIAYRGHTQIVRTLLEHGVEVDPPRTDADDETPLHYAVLRGHLETVQELLKHGADVDALTSYAETPIQKLLQGDTGITTYTWPGSDGYSEEEMLEVMEVLLDERYGIDLTLKSGRDGLTPLETAIKLGRLKMARRLSKHLCSEPKITDSIYPLKCFL